MDVQLGGPCPGVTVAGQWRNRSGTVQTWRNVMHTIIFRT